MADLPQQNTIIQYVADGITISYVVPFYTPVETDGTPNLDVFTQLVTAQAIPENDIKEWNVDYNYTPNLDPITGGIITFLPGKIPPNNFIITIVRDVSASLDVEFAQAATFSGFTLDAALDKLLLIAQQNKSYTLGRNLSYIINSYLPESTISANVQIPVLSNGYIWKGSADGVIATFLEENPNVSTLRSDLANEAPITNGAALVGFYDETNLNPTNVADQLNLLTDGLSAAIPAGFIFDFGGTSAPAGFLVCDGQAVSRAIYTNLFAAIGTTWGVGDSFTTFNVPDFSRRVAVGSGGSGTATLANSVGSTTQSSGNLETVTLSNANMPSGVPTNASNTSGNFAANAGATFNVPANSTQGYTGGLATPINIVQPSAVVLKCIKF